MSKLKRMRLDLAMVEQGHAKSRTHAASLIMAGKVFVGETRLDKAGQSITVDATISVRGPVNPWVSRGGLKLSHGLAYFHIDASGFVGLDVGASTGGFTDVLLANGASKVYAVDVGYGQLHWKLRSDKRVISLEKINARNLDKNLIPEPINVIVCDASFIGLKTILPIPLSFVSGTASLVALIKPQFEVGRGEVGKGGVVREASQHDTVCVKISNWLENLPNWSVIGITESPITGPKGNKEFLICAYYAVP